MNDDTRRDAGGAFGFTCAACGDFHVGMPSFGWDWPVQYLMVAEAERDRRVELDPDYCVIDQRWFFVRGCLDIHVHGHEEPFSWGAWVSLSERSFQRYVEQHDDRARRPGDRFFGWLCSVIPGYPDTQNLKTALHIRPWPDRPFIELEPTDHPLALEQQAGITVDRVQEIAQLVMHPPEDRGRPA